MSEEKLNETKKPEEQQENVDMFLEAAKKVQEDTVPRSVYEKEKAANKKLTDFIVNGKGENPLPNQPQIKEPTKAELLKIIEDENSTNLAYTEAALKLRKKVIDEGGQDPFLPKSSQQPITSADVEGAEKVATVLQECVDGADGDPDTFTFLFEKRVNDTSPIMSAKVKAMKAAKGK